MVLKDLRMKARASLRGKWFFTVGVTFCVLLIFSFLESFNLNKRNLDTFGTCALIVELLISGAICLGITNIFLNLNRNQSVSFKQLFGYFMNFNLYLKSLKMIIVTSVYILLWSLLLIIPGIIKSYSYAMTNFLLVDHPELSVNQALTKSRQMMDGYKWKFFLLQLTFIGWLLLSILSFGIGLLWFIPYMTSAKTQFYLSLSSEKS